MSDEYAAYQPGSLRGPWAPPTDDQGLADMDPGILASMPPPMMTANPANPAMGEVPLYQPTQQPTMTLRDAEPLSPAAPALAFSARRTPANTISEPKATPVTAPVEGSLGKIQKETAAAQADMLKLQKDRQKIADEAEQATFHHAQAIGMQNAATLAETQRQDRIIAHHDAMADQKSNEELAGIRAESSRVANMHVDPTRALPKGVMGSIMGAIGAAIGGAGQALTGHNSFMEIVNTAIDRDIDAQKVDIQGAQAGIARRTGMYQMMRQKFGDDRAALVATKGAYLESVDRYLSGLQAKANTEQAKAKFGDMRASLGQEGDQLWLGWIHQRKAERAAGAAAQLAAQQRLLAEQHWQATHGLAVVNAETQRIEALGKAGQQQQSNVGTLAKELQQAGVPAQEAAIKRAEKDLEGRTVFDTNPASNWISVNAPLTYKVLFGPKEAEAQASWAAVVNEIRHERFGGALSPREATFAAAELESAGTPSARKAILKNITERVAAKRANIEASNPQAADTLRQQTASLTPKPIPRREVSGAPRE